MQPKSHTLFHFTKNIKYVKDILKNGFWPRYCLEDAKWYSRSRNTFYLAYPIVCFCDIPLSRVDEHVNFYGNYGIGVTKEWAQANGLSPVIYLRENSQQNEALRQLCKHNLEDEHYNGSATDINILLAHIKPTEGIMYIDEKLIKKEFYQENEWRYSAVGDEDITGVRPWLPEDDFRDRKVLEEENIKSKELMSLKVSPKDIKYIFVKSDTEIPLLVNYIQTEMDMYPSHDIKILLSRIVSLETISRDL